MLQEIETPRTPPNTEGYAEQQHEQRGQAPFFDSAESEICRDPIGPTFIETLDDRLNAFRFPRRATGGNRFRTTGYKDLRGAEIPAIPSIEEQVRYLESMMHGFIRETVAHAETVGFDRHDPVLQEAAEQINFLAGQAHETSERFTYWERFYKTSDENESGRFIKWNSSRRVGETLAPLVAGRAARCRRRATAQGVQAALLPRDDSVLAKHREVRRCAYEERMNAKIGLAADRVLTTDRIALLKEILPFDDDPATLDLIRKTALRPEPTIGMPDINEMLAKLELAELPEFPDFPSERAEDLIPF